MNAALPDARVARETRRRWVSRIATAFAVWAVVVGIAVWKGNHPDALLLGLTFAAAATTLWLYLDAGVVAEAPVWDRPDDDPVRPPGEDARLALLTRVVGQHLDARQVSDNLHHRLLDLADQRLMSSHGVSWRVDPERAGPLLGPELVALARLRPPYLRMTLQQIDVLLTRIEAL